MTTPKEAQKSFNNGRFSGTDVNPMWRIQKLTELFGPSGIGWWTQNVKYDLVRYEPTNEIACFCTLELVYVDPKTKEQSKPIHGVGGNMFVVQRTKGNQLSDEAYKMAYTDALSIACKALGFAHDIYYQNDRTKYTANDIGETSNQAPAKPSAPTIDMIRSELKKIVSAKLENATQEEKTALTEKVKKTIGMANYLKCDNIDKLNLLLTDLKKTA